MKMPDISAKFLIGSGACCLVLNAEPVVLAPPSSPWSRLAEVIGVAVGVACIASGVWGRLIEKYGCLVDHLMDIAIRAINDRNVLAHPERLLCGLSTHRGAEIFGTIAKPETTIDPTSVGEGDV